MAGGIRAISRRTALDATTCVAPMFTWRSRGYVQDSEEEEDDVDISPPILPPQNHDAKNERVSASTTELHSPELVHGLRLQVPHSYAITHEYQKDGFEDTESQEREIQNGPTTPKVAANASDRNATESPDPLQLSPPPPAQPLSRYTVTPQRPLDISALLPSPLVSLSSQSDDELSDVPSVLEEPYPYVPPKRNVEVQVVIPASTLGTLELTQSRPGREFRARKPIQLHPYLLEGEKYRQDWKARGLKPIVRPRSPSPVRKAQPDNEESQDREFEPDRASSSPPEIAHTTPAPDNDQIVNQIGGYSSLLSVSKRKLQWRNSKGHEVGALPSAKRQRLQGLSKQRRVIARDIADDEVTSCLGDGVAQDVFDLPLSPLDSSSPAPNADSSVTHPRPRRLLSTPMSSLPTPTNSSGMRNRTKTAGARSIDVTTVNNSKRALAPIRIPHIPSSSSSSSSESESEHDESQIRSVRKRIKGVLPASWLRLDQKAQAIRSTKPINQDTLGRSSSDEAEPQKGVAIKIRKPRTDTPIRPLAGPRTDDNLIIISDESGDEVPVPENAQHGNIQQSALSAIEMAARFDARYGDDDDLASMEYDRLDLGKASRPRKRQLKLTDAFDKPAKRVTPITRTTRDLATHGTRKQHGSKASRKTPKRSAPAMSILDVVQTNSPMEEISLPPFIKIALRQARRRPDGGRQSPGAKYIRLHTGDDTEEAREPLRQWRSGTLKAKPTVQRSTQQKERQPLAVRSSNQQDMHSSPTGKPRSTRQPSAGLNDEASVADCPVLGTGLLPAPFEAGSALSKRPRTLPRRPAPEFRTAQLEGLESVFGRTNRKIIFDRQLWRVDQDYLMQSAQGQSSRNPQLAKFLADDDAVQSPLRLSKEIDTGPDEAVNLEIVRTPRAPRKCKARRIDVETRNYRQPSEPALQDLFKDDSGLATVPIAGIPETLQGLGPYGTQYTSNFDVSPLEVGTFFHRSTFIGSGDFRKCLHSQTRDLDNFSGRYKFFNGHAEYECGAWQDRTYSQLMAWLDDIWNPLAQDPDDIVSEEKTTLLMRALRDTSRLIKSLITYVSLHLSFSDAVDRRDFVVKLQRLLERIHDTACGHQAIAGLSSIKATPLAHEALRLLSYLLVLGVQLDRITRHPLVGKEAGPALRSLLQRVSKAIISQLLHREMPSLDVFRERNRYYIERENGIQNEQALVESLVICLHVLEDDGLVGWSFWDLVSDELALRAEKATQVKMFESLWASAFTLLPFTEIDNQGILQVNRRFSIANENWGFVKDLLKRLFSLYPDTFNTRSSSLTEYTRACLRRCHVLIRTWNWRKCEPALNIMFDFFSKSRALKQLRREDNRGSPRFLSRLTDHPSLDIEPDDNSFHIFVKCLALGFQKMQSLYSEKKMRSIVFRCTPNHGRDYPKDQPLAQEDLDALRNHHDLLCTLYWVSPLSCRPKIELLRGLVAHEKSHREACRLNVRAWANLAMFQLSVDEPYSTLQQFASWHRDIMNQTLQQYRQAKTEAENYIQAAQWDGTSDASSQMMKETMKQNQSKVIATLRDCIAGMREAVKHCRNAVFAGRFLADSGVVELLELVDVDDPRLNDVIRDTLSVFREYSTLQRQIVKDETSQVTSEESQDYGAWDWEEDVEEASEPNVDQPLAFLQAPLWHLLSNIFGTERAPDDNLLMDCIDTWVLLAKSQVSGRSQSWSRYLDSFSNNSWSQLRDTSQTRKFSPYFMASLANVSSEAYREHQSMFFTTWLASLVERESVLRFQHRLTTALVAVDPYNPLLKNLPFAKSSTTGCFDITPDTLRTRRLALISSILANMRDDYLESIWRRSGEVAAVKREYEAILKNFMGAMKKNFKELQQGETATGAYVDFVHEIVQFLQQYTAEICPVDSFFTDNVSFPLPATDPKYVVGRLRGYASKLSTKGTGMQLSTFLQTVAQQAALDNQQSYLVQQLSTAVSHEDASFLDRHALRNALLQGIFPTYIRSAFASAAGLVISEPILHATRTILDDLMFDLCISDRGSVEAVTHNIACILHAFAKGFEPLIMDSSRLEAPYILRAITLSLKTVAVVIPTLQYIQSRTSRDHDLPAGISYSEELSTFVLDHLSGREPGLLPQSYDQDMPSGAYKDLFEHCTKSLQGTLRGNWGESQGIVFFGYGQARRDVFVGLGTLQDERARVVAAVENFRAVLDIVYGDRAEV